jgi:hypothetical protein
MTFQDAQDIAYRFAAAAYIRKLTRLVGENEIIKLAGTASRHSTLMIAGDKAFSIQITIVCGEASPCDDLEAVIARANKVTTTPR